MFVFEYFLMSFFGNWNLSKIYKKMCALILIFFFSMLGIFWPKMVLFLQRFVCSKIKLRLLMQCLIELYWLEDDKFKLAENYRILWTSSIWQFTYYCLFRVVSYKILIEIFTIYFREWDKLLWMLTKIFNFLV